MLSLTKEAGCKPKDKHIAQAVFACIFKNYFARLDKYANEYKLNQFLSLLLQYSKIQADIQGFVKWLQMWDYFEKYSTEQLSDIHQYHSSKQKVIHEYQEGLKTVGEHKRNIWVDLYRTC